MIIARMGTAALLVLLVACATTPPVQWIELPEVARFESVADAEASLHEVYESNSFGSVLLVGSVVYANRCSGTTGNGGASRSTGVGGATGSTGVGGATGSTGVGGATESTGVGGATGSTGVGGATESTGVGGATGSTGVGGASGSTGVGGATRVVACSHGAGGYLVRLPAGVAGYELTESRCAGSHSRGSWRAKTVQLPDESSFADPGRIPGSSGCYACGVCAGHFTVFVGGAVGSPTISSPRHRRRHDKGS